MHVSESGLLVYIIIYLIIQIHYCICSFFHIK